MDGVDALTVDLGDDLRMDVDAGLGRPPVVPVAPVIEEIREVGELGALLPADSRDLVRQSGVIEAGVELVELRLRNGDPERFDDGVSSGLCGVSLGRPRPDARAVSR